MTVQATQCPSGHGCPSTNEPKNDVSLLQTKLEMNVPEHGGELSSTVGSWWKSGDQCVFPFQYKDKTYNSCTTEDKNIKWCYTQVDSDGNGVYGKWGECESS